MRLVRQRFTLATLLVLFLAAASTRQLFAQDQKYEGREVAAIQFLPPAQPLDPAELYGILPLKKGQPLHMADVRQAIERLYATGRYKDIKVYADPYQGGVAL